MPSRADRIAAEPPPDDPRFAAACHLKRRYRSRRDAKAGARQMSKLGRGHLAAYRCPYCDCWHLGNPPASKRTGA